MDRVEGEPSPVQLAKQGPEPLRMLVQDADGLHSSPRERKKPPPNAPFRRGSSGGFESSYLARRQLPRSASVDNNNSNAGSDWSSFRCRYGVALRATQLARSRPSITILSDE
jgi:hypothetical protein